MVHQHGGSIDFKLDTGLIDIVFVFGANEYNKTKTMFGARNKDYVGGATS